MNNIKQLTLMVVLNLGVCFFSYGQYNLLGQWTASCSVEKLNISSVSICALCPVSNIGLSVEIKGFDLSFEKEFINLNLENKVTTIPYKWDSNDDSIQFVYKDKSYLFKVIETTDPKRIILKGADGNLLILSKS